MKIGEKIFAFDDSRFERNEQVAGFGKSAIIGVDHDAGVSDGEVVDFPRGWLKAANRVDVRSLPQHLAVKERALGGRAGAQDVGFVSAGSRIDGLNLHPKFMFHLLGKVTGAGGFATTYQSALEVAYVTQDAQVSASLASGAEDTEDTRVFTRQQACCDGAGGSSSHVGEVVGGDDKPGAASVSVQQDVSGLEAVLGIARVFVELHEFHAKTSPKAIMAGHDEKDPIRQLHLGTGRHEGRRKARAESFLDSRNEGTRVEQTVNFHFGQKVHRMTSETY